VQRAKAQSKTGMFRDYGVAEAPPGFQAGWSDFTIHTSCSEKDLTSQGLGGIKEIMPIASTSKFLESFDHNWRVLLRNSAKWVCSSRKTNATYSHRTHYGGSESYGVRYEVLCVVLDDIYHIKLAKENYGN
jgi:hypothetical protein